MRSRLCDGYRVEALSDRFHNGRAPSGSGAGERAACSRHAPGIPLSSCSPRFISAGLQASLPWRFPGGTGVHGRARAVTFFLQIEPSRCLLCPRMPARALADVPVSYPRRVVCLRNGRRDAQRERLDSAKSQGQRNCRLSGRNPAGWVRLGDRDEAGEMVTEAPALRHFVRARSGGISRC